MPVHAPLASSANMHPERTLPTTNLMTTALIPESAPFTQEQRAWLNGFLSGFMGIAPESGAAPQLAATLLPDAPDVDAEVSEDLADAEWHDESLPIDERLKLADGKPIAHRMMAAMAQLDCGSCGYLCQSYSAAIACGEESNLTLCSPGGKETKQALKQLVKEIQLPSEKNGSSNGLAVAESKGSEPTFSRKNPFAAKLVESRCLNKEGSAKDTRHVVIDLADSGLKYNVGDALGVYPANSSELVDSIIKRMGVESHTVVASPAGQDLAPLADVLANDSCLKEPTEELLTLVASRIKEPSAASAIAEYLETGVPDGFDVLDCLELDCGVPISATEFVDALEPLNPRLYSIASSQRHVGDEVHLTVGKVLYQRDGRKRKGVASCMLGGDLDPGMSVKVFVQPNHGGFTVPADSQTPMIMIGPGTGIAPFMAFLQERSALAAPGKNWLFFGDQHEACDFLYEDELRVYSQSGVLTRLDTAFSRDSEKKVYVQDRILEHAAEFWAWLESGAHIYVCGDASRMAADVQSAIETVISMQGKLDAKGASQFLKGLSKSSRYVRDVY